MSSSTPDVSPLSTKPVATKKRKRSEKKDQVGSIAPGRKPRSPTSLSEPLMTNLKQACLDDDTASYESLKEKSGHLHSYIFDAGSEAHQIFVDGVDNLDPFCQLTAMGAVGVLPPDGIQLQILREATSILVAYAPLMAADFAGNAQPQVPVLQLPAAVVNVHHAKIAAHALIERIQNPGEGFPAISSVGGGTFLCCLSMWFANNVVTIRIFRRFHHKK